MFDRTKAVFASRIFGPFIPAGSVTIGNSATYYQTAEAKGEHVARRYRAMRKRGYGAAYAFAKALSGPPIYQPGYSDGYDTSAALGRPWKAGSTAMQWAERPAALGFRFAGYADELARLGHSGWFNRDDCESSTLRAAVWRLPHGRLVPGYVEWEGKGPINGDAAALALGEIMQEPRGGAEADGNETLRDAASRADSIAQYAAEAERENDSAYQAGARAGRRMERAAEARREALELAAEIRKARKAGNGGPAICKALRAALDAKLEAIREAREKRARSWGDCPSWLESVWLDGYGEESDEKAAKRALGIAS